MNVALDGPDGVLPSQMVSVSASVNLPLHHKVQKFSCGTSSPAWSRKKGCKTVVVVVVVVSGMLFVGGLPLSEWEIGVIVGASVGMCCIVVCVIVIVGMNR